MPVSSITKTWDTDEPPNWIGVRIVGVGPNGVVEFLLSELPGGKNNIIAYIQALLDTRILLTDLPIGHPDRVTDPGLPQYFHAEFDSLWYLVARPVDITDYNAGRGQWKRLFQEPE